MPAVQLRITYSVSLSLSLSGFLQLRRNNTVTDSTPTKPVDVRLDRAPVVSIRQRFASRVGEREVRTIRSVSTTHVLSREPLSRLSSYIYTDRPVNCKSLNLQAYTAGNQKYRPCAYSVGLRNCRPIRLNLDG